MTMANIDEVKSEIEKLIPQGYDNRDDIILALVDQVLYSDLFDVAPVKAGFVLNDNPLLRAIEKEVGDDSLAFGIYKKITSWKTWAPEQVLQGILEERFDTATVDSAVYGRAGSVSASDYGAPNGPVLGGWESDENQ